MNILWCHEQARAKLVTVTSPGYPTTRGTSIQESWLSYPNSPDAQVEPQNVADDKCELPAFAARDWSSTT